MLFNKNNNATPPLPKMDGKKTIPSILGGDFHLLGNVICESQIDLGGVIEGNVKCHAITIRQQGFVRGDVSAEEVHVYGKVKGVIKAKSVHLYSSCSVEGTIMHEALSVEDGAVVDGKFKRLSTVNLNQNEFSRESVEDEEMLPTPQLARPYDKLKLIKGDAA